MTLSQALGHTQLSCTGFEESRPAWFCAWFVAEASSSSVGSFPSVQKSGCTRAGLQTLSWACVDLLALHCGLWWLCPAVAWQAGCSLWLGSTLGSHILRNLGSSGLGLLGRELTPKASWRGSV